MSPNQDLSQRAERLAFMQAQADQATLAMTPLALALRPGQWVRCVVGDVLESTSADAPLVAGETYRVLTRELLSAEVALLSLHGRHPRSLYLASRFETINVKAWEKSF